MTYERIIVCGGRKFEDSTLVHRTLDHYRPRMQALACGGARGVDTFAWDWGWKNNFHCERFMANWKEHGRAAGPIRNQFMLEKFKPTLVLAFPGGSGTGDMVQRADRAGVPVVRIVG